MNNSLPATDDFPFLLQMHANAEPWIYLDSAATTLKPKAVIHAVTHALTNHSTNVHRSVYELGDITTELYEQSRRKVASFFGAMEHEVVFLRNATEGINLIASGYPRNGVSIVSISEHHSNLLPWRKSAFRQIDPLFNESQYLELLSQELKKGDVSLVSISHVNNVTGLQTNVKKVAQLVHQYGAVLVVDAAQSAGRISIDVSELDCDFLVCSGHKMYGPSGIGILYGKSEHLHRLQIQNLGGGTVEKVFDERLELRKPPWCFEAGTPAIESAIGLGAAIDYLQNLGMDVVEKYEKELTQYALQRLGEIKKCQLIVRDSSHTPAGVISFFLRSESSHVVARTLSDRYGICIRSGFHCTQPFHDSLSIPPSLRISFGLYNTVEEINRCMEALQEITRNSPR
ncbi:MAG: aminotransferase class V-fold PLP-dependent enzyme [Planctomycetia bacterium]|nr:aminotransferase class V-fold PLP-dependent enzyme [Planctomycetia bacterium]